MRTSKQFGRVVIGILVVLLTSCSFYAPLRVEEDFGNSVRQMVQEQIYDKQAASAPAVDGPNTLDGEYGDATINEYRIIDDDDDDDDDEVRISF